MPRRAPPPRDGNRPQRGHRAATVVLRDHQRHPLHAAGELHLEHSLQRLTFGQRGRHGEVPQGVEVPALAGLVHRTQAEANRVDRAPARRGRLRIHQLLTGNREGRDRPRALPPPTIKAIELHRGRDLPREGARMGVGGGGADDIFRADLHRLIDGSRTEPTRVGHGPHVARPTITLRCPDGAHGQPIVEFTHRVRHRAE